MNEIQKKLNGSSICFSLLPLIDEGYVLNKQAFTNMIKIRWGWHLLRLPENRVSGQKFNVEHALSCKKGGFITIRHNDVRDTTTNLLKIIYNKVKIEPPLVPIPG